MFHVPTMSLVVTPSIPLLCRHQPRSVVMLALSSNDIQCYIIINIDHDTVSQVVCAPGPL